MNSLSNTIGALLVLGACLVLALRAWNSEQVDWHRTARLAAIWIALIAGLALVFSWLGAR